jgi:broad specificity phosphatase PhoE
MANSALSEEGERQARRASEAIGEAPVDAVVTSTLIRATHTGAIIAAARGIPSRADPRLKELPVGGHTYAEKLEHILALPQRLVEEQDPVLVDGLSYHEHVRRFDQAVRQALHDHALPVIVAHGLANRAWLARVLATPPEELLVVAPQEHGQVIEVTLTPHAATIRVIG